jgi:hypothetical protein
MINLSSARESTISGVRGWYKRQRQKGKAKEERMRALESMPLRLLTAILTFTSMILALSFLPLFPQPLPAIMCILIAFVTFRSPRYGMTIGTLVIGLGLVYHLARMDFIAALGMSPEIRVLVIIILLLVFTALPFRFHRYEDAIAIDIGIIAATLLFFNETYYLAAPLIFTAAVLFKKTRIGLTLSYYILISVPLQVIQYFDYIVTIERPDWWLDPNSSPPIFVPLTEVFKNLQQSMLQFRLYETSKVLDVIVNQITSTPAPMERTVRTALLQYLDSFPGIIMFLVIVVGIVSAAALLAGMLVKQSYATQGEVFLPAMTAAGATALFFIFLSAFQGPLAFRAEVNGTQMAIGTVAAVIFTIPASLANYSPKKRAEIEARSKIILEKAQDLLKKLQIFEESLYKVKGSIPVAVSAIEGKMLIMKDTLNDTLSQTSAGFYDLAELEKEFSEIDKGISTLIEELESSVREYQIYVNCEYSNWKGKFADLGLEVKATVRIDFQKDQTLEMRVNSIKEILEAGRLLVIEVSQIVEQIYGIIRSLYDPSLPEESQTVAFVKQKLDEKTAPWIAMDALFTSLNSWRKQYSAKISKSVVYLQDSLTSAVNLGVQSERLLPVLGNRLSIITDNAKRAGDIKLDVEKKILNDNIVNVIIIRNALESLLSIAKDVLSILFEELKSKEKSIESLLPTKDYLWDRNITLEKHMASFTEIILNSSKYQLCEVMENLPKALSYVDECAETIITYNEQEELLLNYPIAKVAIENLFRQKKKQVFAQDLPFETKYAEEYLRLFYSQEYPEFEFDSTNISLLRRT